MDSLISVCILAGVIARANLQTGYSSRANAVRLCFQEMEPQQSDQLLQVAAALIHEHGASSDRDGTAPEDTPARTPS